MNHMFQILSSVAFYKYLNLKKNLNQMIFQTYEKIGVLTVRDNVAVRTCRFSADGKYLITAGDDDQAHIWDTRSLRLIRFVVVDRF